MAQWDDFQSNAAEEVALDRRRPPVDSQRRASDGLLDPAAFLHFLLRNVGKIITLTVFFTIIGVFLFRLIPFPYYSKAIVLVDPREKGVRVSEQVVTNIGGDAAVLESIVQLISSDDFLRPIVRNLDIGKDEQFAKAAERVVGDDDRTLVAAFKSKLNVNRLGATYVVEVGFTADDPQSAAKYANAVARAFIDQQTQQQDSATANAATGISAKLDELRLALQKSEKAVADFRAANNIISVDATSTLLQRELTELSTQVARAKADTEAARARFDQANQPQADFTSTVDNGSDGAQLNSLRQQKAVIRQRLAELSLQLGARHPRIAAERSKLDAVDRDIVAEQRRLVSVLKQRLDTAVATQSALETQLSNLERKAREMESELVTLAELQREADANRTLFQQFLSRSKSTDKQQGLQAQEARLASAAVPPLKSTRPKTTLAGGMIGALSLALSILLITIREASRDRRGPKILKQSPARLPRDPEPVNMPNAAPPANMVYPTPPPQPDQWQSPIGETSPLVSPIGTMATTPPVNAPAPITQEPGGFYPVHEQPTRARQTWTRPERTVRANSANVTKSESRTENQPNRQRSENRRPQQSDRFRPKAERASSIFENIFSGELPWQSRRGTVEAKQPLRKPLPPLPRELQEENHPAGRSVQLSQPHIALPDLDANEDQTALHIEEGLAQHLSNLPGFANLVSNKDVFAPVLLVTSWQPGEGKTTFAGAIAHMAANQGSDALVIKTQQNGALERHLGRSIGDDERPYSIFDPTDDVAEGENAFVSLQGFLSLIDHAQQNFDLVIIDAASIPEEEHIGELSALAYSTCLIVNQPDEAHINDVVAHNDRARLQSVDLLVNRVAA